MPFQSCLIAQSDFPLPLNSLIKAFVFGILVALVATYRGFTAAPSAAGVSAATTSTVVVASVSTLIVDYLITALWGV